jgi:hypothetical protein
MKNVCMFACAGVQGLVSMHTKQMRVDVLLSVLGCVRALTCAGALCAVGRSWATGARRSCPSQGEQKAHAGAYLEHKYMYGTCWRIL